MTDMIYKFTKNRQGHHNGCVLAVKLPGQSTFDVGWSLCSKSDVFSKERALEIARGRAIRGRWDDKCPRSLENDFISMYERAVKYFHNNHSAQPKT